jgi:hypothetical protein
MSCIPAQYSHTATKEVIVNRNTQYQAVRERPIKALQPRNGAQKSVSATVATENIPPFIRRGEIVSRFHFPTTVVAPEPKDENIARRKPEREAVGRGGL